MISVIKTLSVQKDIEYADYIFVAVSKDFRQMWGNNSYKINASDLTEDCFLYLVCNHGLSYHFSQYFFKECTSKNGVWDLNPLNYFGNCPSMVFYKFVHLSFQNFLSIILENCTLWKCPSLSYAIPTLKMKD